MANAFDFFEKITRSVHSYTDEAVTVELIAHPFSERNIYDNLPTKIKKLFDDGHFSQSTFEALKYLDKEVSRISKVSDSGFSLMMKVFSETSPIIKLNDLTTISEIDEQKGYKFIFAGSISAIRNPRGHEYNIDDSMEECLDYLCLVSLLLRKIERFSE